MFDQADKLRQLVQETVAKHPQLEPGAPLVVVHGACEEVGSTTLAIRLARQLNQLGKRLVLVDADLRTPSLAEYMSLEHTGSLNDVLSGRRGASEVLEHCGEGLAVLAGSREGAPPAELSHRSLRRFVTELRSLSKIADLVVLDVGTTMSPWVERLWTSAGQILLVSRAESSSVMQAYAAVKNAPWGDVDGKLRLVINRCDDPQLAGKVSEGFSSTCRKFLGMKLLGDGAVVGTDPRLLAGDRRQSGTSPLQNSTRLLAADVLSHLCTVHARLSSLNMNRHARSSQAAGLFDTLQQTAELAE